VVATLVTTPALAGVLLLGGPTASAETAGTVAFSGGCGVLGTGIGARSTPDTNELSVPAGSEVAFANQLGHPATLRLDGEAITDLAPGDSVEVAFREGPVDASMQISCLLGSPAGTVTVEVQPEQQPTLAPDPASPAPGSGPDPAGSSPGRSGSTSQRTTDPATGAQPGQQSGAGQTSGGQSAGATGGQPSGQVPGGQTSGGWWSGGPGQAGFPPAGPAVPGAGTPEQPGADEQEAAADDPVSGSDTPTDPATVDGQPADGLATGQLTRTAESAPSNGPIGLLALVAAVCVVGVSAGVVRTIIAQRANRAQWA
jgi:hypothetical protein